MRTRRQLWEADPHCHWCGRETSWWAGENGPAPTDSATLDHLYSWLDPRRAGNSHLVVLACWRCNHDRGEQENNVRPPNPPSPRTDSVQPSPGTIGPKGRPFILL